MLIKKPNRILPSEITDEAVYKERRRFLGMAALGTATLTAGGLMLPALNALAKPVERKSFPDLKKGPFGTDEELNSFEEITTYNNFYEFGFGKSDPARYAHMLTTHPWSVSIEGEAEITGRFNLEDILKPHTLEERIYRLRCVEAWSMVIPWVGFSLADLIKRFKPTSKAKFVEFTTLYNPEEMPGQKSGILEWPYVEGLRMDEAMHPLTLLAVGLYGKEMPNQNGAPLRLVVPWKYGFKSIKSVVKIRFTETQPQTTWNLSAPGEYGFYANVNPNVDHPRWSQGRERRIGDFLKRNTETFNGYADEVAHLYSGMDLKKHF
ncbi:MAG: protein-methionine-sulfoxide reductase catalytic subunit MsrP [Gammaproteobacteria bacterium]|nr:protein-methionine-sulfoxide reductase catalytic subunit MsrP [Gammaproteobacteria bacterium]MCW8841702.1 protein-methionine-sulfoxide reductase catalytic subunit MsrP [Gammaproteobacteria bacterium]MCW8927270.1 protein-methionine-sulfoxide reductase catalytic subunit MsrP [Gammaproteobacteria bacterium]MCW8958872.1 protein-methionine-sulfoxide reductase catalytic subunit MsrP [Gammaproteobacteria bacterium]MCW8971700.1 protein-methionine-sulfoxide reductase catalytic subunit MsrP [Gammaprot